MSKRKIEKNSFKSTDDDVLEAVVFNFEVKLEKALKKSHREDSYIVTLSSLCNILWHVISLKYRNRLSNRLDKKLYSSYIKHLRNI